MPPVGYEIGRGRVGPDALLFSVEDVGGAYSRTRVQALEKFSIATFPTAVAMHASDDRARRHG